jgi:hypothetical protein
VTSTLKREKGKNTFFARINITGVLTKRHSKSRPPICEEVLSFDHNVLNIT